MTTTTRNAALMIAALALAGALAPAAPGPAAANRVLAREQLKLAEQAQSDLDQLYKTGEVSAYDPRFALWARRRVEATRASGAGKAELVAALEGYLATLTKIEQLTNRAFQAGRVSRDALHDVRYRRLEAEIWLNQKKAQ